MIQVTDQNETADAINFEMTAGKKTAYIRYQRELGYINVIVMNASHKAYRGGGRVFWGGWQEAKDAYKSCEIVAMIHEAEYRSFANLTWEQLGAAGK